MPSRVRARHLPLLALLAYAACVPAAARPHAPDTLRVMTFNIFAGNDLERRPSLERVAALIDSLRPDVVLLQEVDRLTTRSGGVDQLAVLAERTGMRGWYGPAMPFDGGEYGIAVLARIPIESVRTVPLDAARPDDRPDLYYEPRVLMHLRARTPHGVVHILNTHLAHQPDPAFRHPQLLQVLAWVGDSVPRGEPVVLAGDLNARPETVEVAALRSALRDAWIECGAGAGPTFRSDRPDRRIDYVFYAGLRCTRAAVIDTRISDHLPVVVDLVRAGRL